MKQKNYKKRHVNRYLLFIILCLGIMVVIGTIYVLVSFGVIARTGNHALDIFLDFLMLAIILACIILAIISFGFYKRSSNQIRFNYETFELVQGINSERTFLKHVKRDVNKHKDLENAVITFSVTRFKKIVFTRYGYEKGSEVLGLVYESLNTLKKKYPHSYYGYDYNENFLIYLRDAPYERVKEYINDLTEEIDKTLFENRNEVKFVADFGVSYARNENDELIPAPQMLQRALIAADHGRIESDLGGVTLYEAKMFEINKRNVQLGLEIEHGLELGQFELHYQPKYDLNLGRFAGAEALVRWRHPELGLLSPVNFILFAEQSDLIIKIDHYVLEHACMQIDAWRSKGQRLLPISVNISKRTLFTGNIINHLIKMTDKYNINPMLLEIEIVESPSLQDILLLISIVKKFKNLRVKIAIDDFGTGYSSLSYIKKIPFDVIKIDKAFLDDVDIDQKSRLMIKNIIDLAHILDAYVVMEGVQDEKQVKMLKEMGADAIQGFYYSRPLPPDEYQAFLEDNIFEANKKKKRGGTKRWFYF